METTVSPKHSVNDWAHYKTRNTEHGATEHGTAEHWRKTETLQANLHSLNEQALILAIASLLSPL